MSPVSEEVRAAVDITTAAMREPWHRDLIVGRTASHPDRAAVVGWARGVAEVYSRSGSLEVTACIWALLNELDAALTDPGAAA